MTDEDHSIMTMTVKHLRFLQKINGVFSTETKSASRQKIEILNKKEKGTERYAQQAGISNLLVTVFAALCLDNLLILEILIDSPTFVMYSNAQELTAEPHNHGANTAP